MTTFQYGPLNKSLFTQELELLTKCILYAPDKIHFKVQQEVNGESVHAYVENIDIDVTALLAKANFSHLMLSEDDSSQYQEILSAPYRLEATIPGLTLAENQAIKAYTGNYYYNLNAFLYGKFDNLYAYYSDPAPFFKDLLVSAVFLGSGLNKIMPSVEYSDFSSYRGEHSTPDSEIIHRIELIEQGGGITDQKAYMSTSSDLEIGEMFKGNSLIIFDSIYGKEISSISEFPHEEEFLLLPSQILWESYEQQNGSIIFHARVVSPLIEGKDDVTTEDVKLFNDLLSWAKEQAVPVDFLTSHLNELVLRTFSVSENEDNMTQEMITLQDVITLDNENISFSTQDSVPSTQAQGIPLLSPDVSCLHDDASAPVMMHPEIPVINAELVLLA